MDLNKFFTEIKTTLSYTSEQILDMFCASVSDCCDAEYIKEIYIDMYVSVYGKVMTKELAEDFLESLRKDTNTSIRWTMAQSCIIGNAIGVDWSKITKIDWYTALNLEYQKHYKTAEILGFSDDPNFYARIAKDEWVDGNNRIFDRVIS